MSSGVGEGRARITWRVEGGGAAECRRAGEVRMRVLQEEVFLIESELPALDQRVLMVR